MVAHVTPLLTLGWAAPTHAERLSVYTAGGVEWGMADAETIYSAKAVRERLGISDGMLRRYAIALETVTGEPIKQHPRDGRQYTGEQVTALERAKLRVAEKRGRDVETAIRLALGQTEGDAEAAMLPEQKVGAAMVSPEALAAALEPVITPLLIELRALRESNERLEGEVVGLREDIGRASNGRSPSGLIRPDMVARQLEVPKAQEPPQPAPVGSSGDDGAGVLVRAATRLERLWARLSGQGRQS